MNLGGDGVQIRGRNDTDDEDRTQQHGGGEAPAVDLNEDKSHKDAVEEVIGKGHGPSVRAQLSDSVHRRFDLGLIVAPTPRCT